MDKFISIEISPLYSLQNIKFESVKANILSIVASELDILKFNNYKF